MTEPLLRARGLHKGYRLGQHAVSALRGVDLDVQPGEMLALTGPSGSGKSTLLNLAGLIDRPDAGRLWLAGRDVATLDERAATLLRRACLGFIFQGFNLVPVMDAADNVALPLLLAGVGEAERRRRALQALAEVGLAAHAGHRPDALSGGQRQRVAIARALIGAPVLLIADEPTASLDAANAAQVLALLRERCRARGAACLIATHDPRVVRDCDRVVALEDGRIVEPASPPAGPVGAPVAAGRQLAPAVDRPRRPRAALDGGATDPDEETPPCIA